MSVKLVTILQQHKTGFAPVVPFDSRHDRLLLLNLTADNDRLTDIIINDEVLFNEFINEELKRVGARYAIGGYAEHRTVYSRSKVFDASIEGEEPRRFHLGTDIWGPVNTRVSSPLDAIVHSFAFNDRFGDYGTTIILQHRLHDHNFFTLYGHLSLDSIKGISEGDTVLKGEAFAKFGSPEENGHWPPHLHFQIINDLEGWKGDYPGVCRYSERESYLDNCPDPELILGMEESYKAV